MYFKNYFIFYFIIVFLLIIYGKCQINTSFLVSIQKILNFHNYRHIGSGTIITEEWVLSTAFIVCSTEIIIIGKSCTPKYMYLILPNVTHISYYNLTGENVHVVSQIFVHPEFHIDLVNLFNANPNHNIALYKLKSKLTFNDFIQPIPIKKQFIMNTSTEEYCVMIGWTANIPYGNKYLSSGVIKPHSYEACHLSNEEETNNGLKFCAECKDCKDPCFIDPGSPLICKNQLAAMTLKDSNWCTENTPMLRIDSYYDWITSVMRINSTREYAEFRSTKQNITTDSGVELILTHWLIYLFILMCI